ncbi:major facilitator superfamily protein [Fictibacillus macauensis ZFHKF-1]|uniref:Major facilitator superfamily protein n=1 Tax=Fictibacillus macauensis ZFHKF-1 TaxID=1196324 RepID=I8J312_9BACL|nr:MDR family MFS transporter [Fictibacillus macauensis]EIT86141.1 major facilitator superfamily protein [Fictibacillus macauensis ZFHKF-1]
MNDSATRPKIVAIALLIATFLTAIEGTIVSTAMPKIVGDLGGSQLYTWVISVYLLATVISTPIFGKLADLYGRKKMFASGVIIFLIGSLLSGFAATMGQLVLFRLIQGIGAGALTTIPFTIIGDIFTYEQRAKVQGYISSVWGIAGIIGPLAGGFIVDQISWHWVFFMNLPFGIVALFILWTSLHEHVEKKKQKIDYGGIVTFAISMSAFLYALTLLKETKSLSGSIVGWFLLAFIGVMVFLRIERKTSEPMLPLQLFRIRAITVANIAGFLLGFILVAITFYIPLWIQGVNHSNATYSGIAMLPMSLTWPTGAVLSGKWLPKSSAGRLSLVGIAIIFIGLLPTVFFQASTSLLWMMIATSILGLGFGLSLTTFTVAVQSAVGWNLRGAAMGSNNLMRNLGQAVGIAVSGLWLSSELAGTALANSLHQIFYILVGLAIVGCLTTFSLITKEKKASEAA